MVIITEQVTHCVGSSIFALLVKLKKANISAVVNIGRGFCRQHVTNKPQAGDCFTKVLKACPESSISQAIHDVNLKQMRELQISHLTLFGNFDRQTMDSSQNCSHPCFDVCWLDVILLSEMIAGGEINLDNKTLVDCLLN